MGWLFTQSATKADIINNLIAAEENDTRRWETLRHCVRGNVLWAVVEITYKDDRPPKRFIGCYLLAKEDGYGWGYKDMEESMYPYYYSCPLKYLDMVPVANADWRVEVRKHHGKRNRKLEKGQRVAIVGSSVPWVTIRSLRPLLGEYDGLTYRVPRRMLGDVICA